MNSEESEEEDEIVKEIEMEVTLDVSSPNYDQSKGEQIALNVDGNQANMQTSTTFETNVMDKQTLQSTYVPSQGKRYVVGIVQNDEVHLTPISKVLQLRPSFKYMDRAEHRASQAAKAKAAEADSSQDEAEEAKAVTVRFKGAETEAARLARERSYAAYEKRIAEEKWIATRFHDKKDSYAERERQRLICQNIKQVDYKTGASSSGFSEMVQTPSQYLSELVPVYTEHTVDNTCMPNNVLSISLLKKETFADQLKLLMKNAKIIHFSHLMSLLPTPPEFSTVVRSLQSYAVLVKGCWIAKSDILYPSGTLSPITGIQSESLCKARDYLLYLFTQTEYLVRKEVTNTVKMPGEDIKAFLDDIAVMHVGKGWRLRLESDKDFMKRFPEVCERQDMLWTAQASKLSKYFNITNEVPGAGNMDDTKIKQAKDPVTSPPRKKKVTTEDPTSPTAKQQIKNATKRQRRSSGPKSSPSRLNNAVKTTKTKTSPSPSKVNLTNAFVQSNSEHVNAEGPNVNLTSIISPKREPAIQQEPTTPQPSLDNNLLANLGSPKMNMVGINSTVHAIANQMRQMGSPQNVQYYIPQMNIATVNSENQTVPETNHNGSAASVMPGQNIDNFPKLNDHDAS